jgi:hypothetical protein
VGLARDSAGSAGDRLGTGAAQASAAGAVRRRGGISRHEIHRAVQESRPHEREQQQCREQSGPRRRGGLAGNGPGGASTGLGRIPGPPEFRQDAQGLHDLLVQFAPGQHRQQLCRPPARAVVTPALAGAALAQVPCHGHPKGNRQHRGVPPAFLPIGVPLSISQYLPQFPAPGSAAARRAQGGFRGRERGDLESAQYRLPVLAAQPLDLGNAGA